MPKARSSKEAPKTVFLNIRINERQKDMIGRAATLRKCSLSEFVIENAYDAATQILTDKAQFVLSPQAWDAFCEALDAPPKAIPALKELFNKPDFFNEQ